MKESKVTERIIGAAIEVHKELGGPGLLESVYEQALNWELRDRGFDVQQQLNVPILYKGHKLTTDLRLDLLVNDQVIVECKATTEEKDVFKSQLLTYLRLTDHKLGLLINFGKPYVRDGITRVVNDL